ncbi:Cell morphogenesis protein PAG1 [Sorochytrium milnesiophthora]
MTASPSPSIGAHNTSGDVDSGGHGWAAAAGDASPATHQLLQRFSGNKDTEELTPQTPLEWCLDAAFASFVTLSETKLDVVLKHSTDREIDLHAYLQEGVDVDYDAALSTLGSLGQHSPTLVIDSLMAWRDAACDLVMSDAHGGSVRGGLRLSNANRINHQRDLRLLAANVLFCRACTQVVKNLEKDKVTDDITFRIEDLAFAQMKNVHADLLKQSVNWQSHCNHFAQLLGELSSIRFASVSDRYVAELERLVSVNMLREGRVEHIILGMRYLRIKIYPMDALEETAEFLESVGNFFMASNDASVRQAFIELFQSLIAPTCAIMTAEVNLPTWAKFVDSVFPRVCKMLFKLRHAIASLQLATTLLCVSRSDYFASNWMQFMDVCIQKFKERTLRNTSLNCLNKLLWMYLFKYSESPANTYKRLESLIRLLFPPNRRSIHPPETSLDNYIEIVYQIGLRFPTWSLPNVFIHLVGAGPHAIGSIENVPPERNIICLRAFLHMLECLERGQNKPAFPGDASSFAPQAPLDGRLLPRDSKLKQKFADQIRLLDDVFSKTLQLLDQSHGCMLLTDERWRAPSMRQSPSSNALLQLDTSEPLKEFEYVAQSSLSYAVTISKDKWTYLELIKTILKSLPRLQLTGLPYRKLLEMVSRYTNHVDHDLAIAAHQTLLRLAKECGARTVVSVYGKCILDTPERCSELYDEIYTTVAGDENAVERKRIGMLTVYAELLQTWADEQYEDANAASLDNISNDSIHTGDAADMKPIPPTLSDVDRIETIVMLFLCSSNPRVRRKALGLLDSATRLAHKKYRNAPPRLGALLECVINEMLPHSATQSAEQQPPTTTARSFEQTCAVAHSTRPRDLKMWSRVVPRIANVLQEFRSAFAKSCWAIITDRIVQLHGVVSSSTDWGASSGLLWTGRSAPPPDAKAAQWKLYCLFACASLDPAYASSSSSLALSLPHSDTVTSNSPGLSDLGRGFESLRSKPTFSQLTSARDFVGYVLTFITSDHQTIRDGIVKSLGYCSPTAAHMLTTELIPYLSALCDDTRTKLGKRYAHPRRPGKVDRLRYELPRLLRLLFANCDMIAAAEDDFLASLILYLKLMRTMLSELRTNVEGDFHLLPTKIQFAGCVEHIYDRYLASSEYMRPTSGATFSHDLRTSLFSLFDEWCGHGAQKVACTERSQRVISFALEQVKDLKDRAPTERLLDEQQRELEVASLQAMCVLCFCSSPDNLQGSADLELSIWRPDEIQRIIDWVNDMLTSSQARIVNIGRRALTALLQASAGNELSDLILHFSYSSQQDVQLNSCYFLSLSEACINGCQAEVTLDKLLVLSMLKSTSHDARVRRQAFDMLCYVEDSFFLTLDTQAHRRYALSDLPAAYQQCASLFTCSLAANHPEMTYGILSELFFRLGRCHVSAERQLLRMLLPLLQNVKLTSDAITQAPSKLSDFVLHNMLWLTTRFTGEYAAELDTCYKVLVVDDNLANVPVMLSYLISWGMNIGGPRVVGFVRQIMYAIGRSTSFTSIVQLLMADITPRAFIPVKPSPPGPDALGIATDFHVFRANLDYLTKLPASRSKISRGTMASLLMLYLIDDLPADMMVECLPLLLHALIVQTDHPNPMISQQMRQVCQHLLQVLSGGASDSNIPKPGDGSATDNAFPLWHHSDNQPAQLDEVVAMLVERLNTIAPSLRARWCTIALQWASTCTILHIAVRSLQVFRVLAQVVTQNMIIDLFSVLRNAMADNNINVRTFCEEIIMTLQHVVGRIDPSDTDTLCSLFWCCVAILLSDDNREIAAALQLLDRLLDVMHVEHAATQAQIMQSIPRDWGLDFYGLQPLLLPLLREPLLCDRAMKLINRLLNVRKNELADISSGRWLFATLVNVPHFLSEIDQGRASEETQSVATRLADQCTASDAENLSRLFHSIGKQKFKSTEDLLKHLSVLIKEAYFPTFAYESLRLLLILAQNTASPHRPYVLRTLKALVPKMSGSFTVEQSKDIDLVRPLLEELRDATRGDVLAVVDEILIAVAKHTERSKYSTVLTHKASTIQNRKARKAVATKVSWIATGTRNTDSHAGGGEAKSRRAEASNHITAVLTSLAEASPEHAHNVQREAPVPYSTDYTAPLRKSISMPSHRIELPDSAATDTPTFAQLPSALTPDDSAGQLQDALLQPGRRDNSEVAESVVPTTTLLVESLDSLTSALIDPASSRTHSRWQSGESDDSGSGVSDPSQLPHRPASTAPATATMFPSMSVTSSASAFVSDDEPAEEDGDDASLRENKHGSKGSGDTNASVKYDDDDEPPTTQILDDSDDDGAGGGAALSEQGKQDVIERLLDYDVVRRLLFVEAPPAALPLLLSKLVALAPELNGGSSGNTQQRIDHIRARLQSDIAEMLASTEAQDKATALAALHTVLLGAPAVGADVLGQPQLLDDMLEDIEFSTPSVQRAALQVLCEASGVKACQKSLIDCPDVIPQLEAVLSSADDASLRSLAAIALSKIALSAPMQQQSQQDQQQQPKVSEQSKGRIADFFISTILAQDAAARISLAVEGLMYATLETRIKVAAAEKPGFLAALLRLPSTMSDPMTLFGIASIVLNLSLYPPKLNEQQQQLATLRRYASRAANGGAEAPLEQEEQTADVTRRCAALMSNNVMSAVAIIYQHNSKQSAQLPAVTAHILYNLATHPPHRGALVAQGGVAILLDILSQLSTQHAAPDSSTGFYAARALSKIAISVDPRVAFVRTSLQLVSPLMAMLDLTDDAHNLDGGLTQFEALLALTNLASMGDSLQTKIASYVSAPAQSSVLGAAGGATTRAEQTVASSNRTQTGFSLIQYLVFSNDMLIRRAALELTSNLCMCELVYTKLVNGVVTAGNVEPLRVYIALCDEEDDPATQRAASGVLAVLSSEPAVARLLIQDDKSKATLRRLISLDPDSESPAEQQASPKVHPLELAHRASEVYKNMLAALENSPNEQRRCLADLCDDKTLRHIRSTLTWIAKNNASPQLKCPAATLKGAATNMAQLVQLVVHQSNSAR